jgi:hypothetical protein
MTMQQKTTDMVSAIAATPGSLSVHWMLTAKFWRLPNHSILSRDEIINVSILFFRYVTGFRGKV